MRTRKHRAGSSQETVMGNNALPGVFQTFILAILLGWYLARESTSSERLRETSSLGKNSLIWIKRSRLIFFSLKEVTKHPGSSSPSAWSSPHGRVPVNQLRKEDKFRPWTGPSTGDWRPGGGETGGEHALNRPQSSYIFNRNLSLAI